MTLKGLLRGTCCAAAVLSAPVYAMPGQDAQSVIGDPVAAAKIAADDDQSQTKADKGDVVVTGTRIVRPNNRSAAPITTITANDIAIQGAATVEEVLNRMPQVQANSEQNYADSNGTQRIKLRNLGFERTLTLVDGMRLGLQNGGDVSIIPTALVDRIDVLSGGASSVYGADAVSGVVNFILKKDYEGVQLSGTYSLFNHDNRENPVTDAARRAYFPVKTGMVNDGARANLNATFGKNLFDGRVNITGFLGYVHSDIVPLGNRSYSACEVTQAQRDGPLGCSVASFTANGTIIPRSGSLANTLLVNNPNGSRNFVRINSGPNTAANPYDGFSFQREFERINAGGFLTAKISDDIELYSTALFYRDRSRNPQLNRTLNFSFYGSDPYLVNCDNPFLSTSQAQTLCGANAGSATANGAFDLRYRFDGQPPADNRFQNKGVRVQAGLRGDVLEAWHYDVAAVYARNELTSRSQPIPDFDRVQRSLQVVNRNGTPTCKSVIDGSDPNCVPFDAFSAYNNSGALNNYIFYSPFGASTNIPRLWQVVTSLSGDLGKYGITSPFAEDGIAVAFGSEFRAEKFSSTADAQFRETSGGQDVSYTQNVFEVNAEIQAPLVEKQRWTEILQLNAGYRQSRYNRLQSSFSTWKLEGIWGPISDITFRGSINKAQAAPTVIQADQASTIFYTTAGSRNDPCAPQANPQDPNSRLPPVATLEQCRRTGLPDNLYGSPALNCPNDSCTIRNGGFGLTPETAYTKTFGVVLRPRFLPGLTVSVDRFLIDLNNSISYFSAADFLNGCLTFGLDYYCRGVVRNPGSFTLYSPPASNPTTGWIAQGTTNGYKATSHGWDFQGQYNLGLGAAGRLDLSFNGTLMTFSGGQGSPDIKPTNCVGYFGPFCGESLPKWKHGLATTWVSPDKVTSFTVNWRHVGPMTLSYNATDPSLGIPVTAADRRNTYAHINAYNYIDLSANFNVTKAFSFRLSVNNLFDKDPPLLPNSRNVLGLLRSNTLFNYDLLGRQFVAGAVARF